MQYVVDMKNKETGEFIGYAVFDTDSQEIVSSVFPDFEQAYDALDSEV